MASPPYISAKPSYAFHLARFDRTAATARLGWSETPADIINRRHVGIYWTTIPTLAHHLLPILFVECRRSVRCASPRSDREFRLESQSREAF
jgi:hypothetical protein